MSAFIHCYLLVVLGCVSGSFNRNDHTTPSDWMISELIKVWNKVIVTHAKVFFETRIKTFPERWHKCIAVSEDYNEK
jgi:hypothetical protein